MTALFEFQGLGHVDFFVLLLWPGCFMVPLRQRESAVFEGKIFTDEIIDAFAVVLKTMELGQHEQALHDHSLQFSLGETKVEETRKTSAYSRRWCRGKD